MAAAEGVAIRGLMIAPRYDFASDNTAGACPEAMEAIIAANQGFAASYGEDDTTRTAGDLVREALDADVEVRFLASGTAANAIAAAALCRPFESIIAHDHAHIRTDETGAPQHFGHGLGIIGVPGAHGRMDLAAAAEVLEIPDSAHRQSPAALSITNITEYGTLYAETAVRSLTDLARRHGLATHFDGARLANAAAAGFDLRAIKTLEIDLLVFGGTKAGASLSEAVVIFNPALARRFDARLKNAGQLASKSRFLSAPWIGLLRDGALVRRARHANAMAARLAAAMPFPIVHPVEANGVFVAMADGPYAALAARGWRVFRFLDGSTRFLTSWATTPEAVDALISDLRGVAEA